MSDWREKAPSGICERCHEQYDKLVLDHVIPRSNGGPHHTNNLQWMCIACHSEKTRSELQGNQFNKGVRRQVENTDRWSNTRPRGACNMCGLSFDTLIQDHIIPRFEGGSHDTSNMQWLCETCEKTKTREEMSRRRRDGRTQRRDYTVTLETREKLRKAFTGRTTSEETKEKIRQAMLKKGQDPEYQAKLSEGASRNWKKRKGGI